MRPMFGVWIWRDGITVVLFRKLFQCRTVKGELFSQRNDKARIRIFGCSIKLFG